MKNASEYMSKYLVIYMVIYDDVRSDNYFGKCSVTLKVKLSTSNAAYDTDILRVR
jgi:hypothetical protein